MDLTNLEIVGGAPDVRNWPETSRITAIRFTPDNFYIAHTKQFGDGRWPDVTPMGWTGTIQFTLWVVVKTPSGRTVTTGCIEFPNDPHYRNGGTGSPFSDLTKNWNYFAPEFEGYQPQVGEEVGFFVTAGDQRRKDAHKVAERSNVAFVRVAVDEVIHFDTPAPVSTPDPVPTPVLVPTPPVEDFFSHLDALERRIMARFDESDAKNAQAVNGAAAYVKPTVDFITRWFGVGKGH